MIKAILGVALACGLGFSQVVDSKLKGKRIYMHKNDGGHQGGYDGLKAWLESKKSVYGYEFEATGLPLNENGLNALFNRLYKGPGVPRQANTIDVLIFCQGEGDGNMGRGPFPKDGPNPGNAARHTMVNTHVKAGGALILVHAAAGREISYWKWDFGAMLMGSWFLDCNYASPLIAGNCGHFGANTTATATLDEETTTDKSLQFIRNIFLGPKDKGGFGQPLTNSAVKGEWYHLQGNFKYEDGTGGPVVNPMHTSPMYPVRGNPGFPDSGIGPTKIIKVLTKINSGAGYTPPGKGRHIAWAREVSWGRFDATKSETNGRFIYDNTGHDGSEWTIAGNWMGDNFLAMLRWAVKDDRGCTEVGNPNYKPWATVNDGTCNPISIGRSVLLTDNASAVLGRVAVANSVLDVSIKMNARHSVKVVDMKGRPVYETAGFGVADYQVPGLEKGSYVVMVDVDGQSFKRLAAVR